MKSVDKSSKNKRLGLRYRDPNIQIIFGITLIAIMGNAIITPAFPKIVQELKISTQEVGLLISAFTLPMIIIVLALGVLADRFGRKKIIAPSLMLFGIAGGACAFARDFNILLILRFLQGIGAASLFPLSFTVISDIYSSKEFTRAMGYNVGIAYLGNSIYPFIGGALGTLAWYFPFFIFFTAIPIGLLVLFSLKNPEPKKDRQLRKYLKNVWLSMKNSQLLAIFIIAIITYIIFSGTYLTYLPIWMERSLGASSFIIGLIISIMPLTASFASSKFGKLAKIYPGGNLFKAAFILYSLALITIPFVSSPWMLLLPMVIFGIAHGINDSARLTTLTKLSPIKQRAAFLSLDEMFLLLGITLGPIIMGTIFSVWGTSSVFYIGAIFSITVFLLAAITIQ